MCRPGTKNLCPLPDYKNTLSAMFKQFKGSIIFTQEFFFSKEGNGIPSLLAMCGNVRMTLIFFAPMLVGDLVEYEYLQSLRALLYLYM